MRHGQICLKCGEWTEHYIETWYMRRRRISFFHVDADGLTIKDCTIDIPNPLARKGVL